MDDDLVYLAQTDTTVGFLCANSNKLSYIKDRPASKNFINVFGSLNELRKNIRIPKRHRKSIRHSKSISYIQTKNNFSFRYVNKSNQHCKFISRFSRLFSTSANESGKQYEYTFAQTCCDVLVLDKRPLEEKKASKIIMMGKKKARKIR